MDEGFVEVLTRFLSIYREFCRPKLRDLRTRPQQGRQGLLEKQGLLSTSAGTWTALPQLEPEQSSQFFHEATHPYRLQPVALAPES